MLSSDNSNRSLSMIYLCIMTVDNIISCTCRAFGCRNTILTWSDISSHRCLQQEDPHPPSQTIDENLSLLFHPSHRAVTFVSDRVCSLMFQSPLTTEHVHAPEDSNCSGRLPQPIWSQMRVVIIPGDCHSWSSSTEVIFLLQTTSSARAWGQLSPRTTATTNTVAAEEGVVPVNYHRWPDIREKRLCMCHWTLRGKK